MGGREIRIFLSGGVFFSILEGKSEAKEVFWRLLWDLRGGFGALGGPVKILLGPFGALGGSFRDPWGSFGRP